MRIHFALRSTGQLFAALLVGTLMWVGGGCSKGQIKEGGDATIKLRRVDVAQASFDTLSLEVVVAVENTSDGPMTVSGGDATLTITGPATESAQMAPAHGEGISEVTADDADSEDDEDEEGDDDAEDEEDKEEGDDDEDEDEDDSGDDGQAAELPSKTTFKGSGGGGTPCPPGETTEVRIPVAMPLPSDAGELERLIAWSRILVEVEGTLQFGGRTESFSRTRELGLPALPEVRLKLSQVASEDQGRAGAAFMSIAIFNPNPFPIKVDRFAWGVTVGEKAMSTIGDGESEKVPPAAEAVFEDKIQLNEETYGKDVKKLLNQPTIPYRVEGFIEIRGIRRPFQFDGEMAFAR
jgi:LEA14-like dessication related protein